MNWCVRKSQGHTEITGGKKKTTRAANLHSQFDGFIERENIYRENNLPITRTHTHSYSLCPYAPSSSSQTSTQSVTSPPLLFLRLPPSHFLLMAAGRGVPSFTGEHSVATSRMLRPQLLQGGRLLLLLLRPRYPRNLNFTRLSLEICQHVF